MTSVLGFLALSLGVAPPPTPVAETLLAAQAVAASELATWRNGRPDADLTLEFAEDRIPKGSEWTVRQRLSYKNPLPVLNARVLTIVLASTETPKVKQVLVDAYVFQGSFPRGFRARYVVSTAGKRPRVVSREIVERYDLQKGKPQT